MQYDPIQALLGGITSTVGRAFLILASFLSAILCYSVGENDFVPWTILFFPFLAFGTIFTWGSAGIPFFIGLISIIAFFITAWIFLDTADPKSLFLLLFTTSVIYFIPITWQRDFVVWRAILAIGSFYILYFSLGYVLPATARYYQERHKA